MQISVASTEEGEVEEVKQEVEEVAVEEEENEGEEKRQERREGVKTKRGRRKNCVQGCPETNEEEI